MNNKKIHALNIVLRYGANAIFNINDTDTYVEISYGINGEVFKTKFKYDEL